MQLRLALGGSCSFPLGEAQHEVPSAPRHLHSLPNPFRFPAFLTLSQPSRRGPVPAEVSAPPVSCLCCSRVGQSSGQVTDHVFSAVAAATAVKYGQREPWEK